MAVVVALDERLERIGDDVASHLLAFEQRLLRDLLRGDVAGNLGGADDRAGLRPDRGDAERDVDPPVVLVDANGIEFDFFPGSYSVENVTGLDAQSLRDDDGRAGCA